MPHKFHFTWLEWQKCLDPWFFTSQEDKIKFLYEPFWWTSLINLHSLCADHTRTSRRAFKSYRSRTMFHFFKKPQKNVDNTLQLKNKKVMNSACMRTCACWLRSPLVLRSALCLLCFYCTISGFYYWCCHPLGDEAQEQEQKTNKNIWKVQWDFAIMKSFISNRILPGGSWHVNKFKHSSRCFFWERFTTFSPLWLDGCPSLESSFRKAEHSLEQLGPLNKFVWSFS